MNFKLIATCAAGIESIVGNELKHLGYKVNVENGRVRFDGDVADIAKTNLWLRTADRIKIVVGEFTAKTFEELFQGVESLNWEDFLPLDAEFPVAGKSQKSTLHNVPSVQAITKKAIVTKMSTVYHRRTKLPETGALYPIEVAINKDKVLITLDTTGSSLFKRGYRVNKGGAPLKENMAAALVLLARWYPEMPFVDPVCGSGTIPIEAALIGCNIAPGLKRNFAFENWDWVDKDIIKQAREQAQAAIKKDIDLDISGYDIDGSMIEIAKENAVQAGVQDIVNFKQMAVKDFKTDKINGVIVANPPYGERLSDKEHVHQLYQQMGKLYQPLTSWSKYILTSDLQFEQFYGTKATKRRKLYNGSLRTDFFQYWGKKIRN
ncbi:THUMP domain-containing class I SAM-dependent RNA methyltransferase [Ligilactobacillus salivarius]|uniref:FIG001721: Predicted N6-adenine-specific DNA methylase n=2 Tax=Ligilactobacillus salivarius TaxID=1624 RepID=V6DJ84_9LACO|nr:class I SAM-dependent RNA methyltransferase [Ligilactobacillus salivarius]MCR4912798.1 class I SAM-dependent RNA methyltransferase [Lactobacillus sp.]CDK34769.1 FIG001721: Predicted N6-adenine-specific DNA methylase [Ligilactobacillus salivarius cp400]AIR10536.1 RNA methyltransferase [Ligilactobacillus salivarius]ATP36234.1 class I SAM-dependent RNA methyltransferase [Ligilactobacillus salivarius]MBS5941639.1 class I SAM-dependent RNA methyltransferase [Ligilactobacillus salivarius]